MIRRLFRDTPALGGALLALAAAAVGYYVRYAFVEPEAMGAACYRDGPWWCPLRTGLIVATELGGFGWAALALAALAALLVWRGRRARGLAFAALAIGGAGLILYNATPSAPAVLLAGLLLVRAPQRAAKPADLGP